MSGLAARLAALGLALAVLAGAVFGLALPAIERYRALGAEIETLSDQRDRFLARLDAAGPAVRLSIGEAALFEGSSEAVAAAAMQEAIAGLVAAAGGTVGSMRTGAARPLGAASADAPGAGQGGRVLALPVSVELTADVTALPDILHRTETHRPYLTVARLEARRARRRASSDDTAISLRLEVVGYMPAPGGT